MKITGLTLFLAFAVCLDSIESSRKPEKDSTPLLPKNNEATSELDLASELNNLGTLEHFYGGDFGSHSSIPSSPARHSRLHHQHVSRPSKSSSESDPSINARNPGVSSSSSSRRRTRNVELRTAAYPVETNSMHGRSGSISPPPEFQPVKRNFRLDDPSTVRHLGAGSSVSSPRMNIMHWGSGSSVPPPKLKATHQGSGSSGPLHALAPMKRNEKLGQPTKIVHFGSTPIQVWLDKHKRVQEAYMEGGYHILPEHHINNNFLVRTANCNGVMLIAFLDERGNLLGVRPPHSAGESLQTPTPREWYIYYSQKICTLTVNPVRKVGIKLKLFDAEYEYLDAGGMSSEKADVAGIKFDVHKDRNQEITACGLEHIYHYTLG